MTDLWSNVRFAIRSLRRSPVVTVAAILTLALSIGAVTVIFSAIEGLLVRPLPVHSIDAIVAIETGVSGKPFRHLGLSPGEVYDLNNRRELFQGVAGYRAIAVNLTGSGEPRRVSAIATIGPLFDVIGVRPYAGRFYSAQDIEAGDKHVVVLSYDFWQALTGGDPASIGRSLRLDDQSYRLIGVLPPGLNYPAAVQLWTPQPPFPAFDARTNYCCRVATAVGRLRAGVTIERARPELVAQMETWRRQFPAIYAMQSGAGAHPQTIGAQPIRDVIAGEFRPVLLLVLGATGLLLVIACANVASLQLVRTIGRSREIAIRSAIGASRTTIAAQLVAESVIMSAFGALIGVTAGAVTVAGIARSDEWQHAISAPLSFDWRVFAASTLVTAGVAILAGAAPALHATRIGAGEVLKSTMRATTAGPRRERFLQLTLVVQVALSLAILLACMVAIRSLNRMLQVDPGFRTEGVMRMRLALTGERYRQNSERLAFTAGLLDQLARTPGVIAAGTVSGGPFSQLKPDEASMLVKAIHGGEPSGAEARATVWIVDGDYFRAMGIPLREGRNFNASDDVAAPRVWLVDEILARQLFPGDTAVGKQIDWPVARPTIVGVVGSVKKSDLAAPYEPSLYWSYRQYVQPEVTVVVRSPLAAANVERVMRGVVHELDPSLPVFDLMPIQRGITQSVGPRRVASKVLAAFAVVSLVLTVLGIYGVIGYTTAQRTKAIGIRIALGANAADVVRGVLRRSIGVVGTGIIVGLGFFVALSRVVTALVFGIGPRDPVTIALGVSIVTAVAIVASWVPARRAALIDPLDALRHE